MPTRPNKPDHLRHISRRRFLEQWLFGTALASSAVLEASHPAHGLVYVTSQARKKTSKTAAKYQNSPNGGERCGGCEYFVRPDGCRKVAGAISPQGWCRFYEVG